MPSERVAKVIEDLNLGVSVPQTEKRGGFELTAAELTEVLMRLRPLGQGRWGDPLRALIAARRPFGDFGAVRNGAHPEGH